MLIEVWVETILPGKDNQAEEWQKEALELAKKRGKSSYRAMRPETGRLNKMIIVGEWNSHADRTKSWENLPEETVALLEKRKDVYDVSALEHYYYNELE